MERIERRFDFRSSDPGWSAGFADVAVAYGWEVGFVADHRPIPPPLEGNGLYQFGNNVSDDLFMWFAGRADGFEPGAEYAIAFEVGIASRVGADCDVGTGVLTYVEAGASSVEPARLDAGGYWVMNVDHGMALGDLRNALPGCPLVDPPWGERTLSSGGRRLRARADENGAIWFSVATDSGFEAVVEVYFTHLAIDAIRSR